MKPAPPATKYRSRAWPCLWAVVTIAAPATSAAAATAANARYANIGRESSMAIGAPPRLLGEILVAEGLTTTAAIDRALARQRNTGELIGEALVALGAINEDDVARALAVQQDLPYVWREELPSTVPVLKNISAKYLRQYRVCPLTIEGGVLTVASADPLNAIVADDLRQATGLTVKFVVSSATGILETIDRNYDGANATALQRIVEGIDEDRGPEEGD